MVSGLRRAALLETDHAGATVNANLTEQVWQLMPVLELGVGLTWQRYGWKRVLGVRADELVRAGESAAAGRRDRRRKFGRRQSDLAVEAIFFRLAKSF